MKKLIVVVSVFCLLDIPLVSYGQSIPAVPDLTKFTEQSRSHIEIIISEKIKTHFGFDVQYRSLSDPNEFVRVVYKHVPSTFREPNKDADYRLFSQKIDSLYSEKSTAGLMAELFSHADPVIVWRWRTKKDEKTGKTVADGKVEVWFQKADGDWLFATDQEISVEFLSERIDYKKKSMNLPVGRKYSLYGQPIIFKSDRPDILEALGRK